MKHPLISSYGSLPGISDVKLALQDLDNLYDTLCSRLELKLNHEECNHHTLNSKDVFGGDNDLDLPLYEYNALPPAGWIRLLKFTISRTRDGRSITCTLSHHTFEEAESLHYDALSYAWGNPYRTYHIVCDDRRIPITANLADWLQHRENDNYVFWIDAFCINQVDKAERSHQVDQMRDVYRSARKVIAWVCSNSPPDGRLKRSAESVVCTSDQSAIDQKALTAFIELQEDYHTVTLGPRHVMALRRDLGLDIWSRLSPFWTYFQVQSEILCGLLLRTWHLMSCFLQASPRTIHHWEVYKWRYTSKRRRSAAPEHPLAALIRRPYFTRRWVSTLRIC